MNWFSGYGLSWRISNTLDILFSIKALQEVLVKGKPDIFKVDQGSQFTSDEFIWVVQTRGIRISMGCRGRAMANIMIERLSRSVKYEEGYLKDYQAVRYVHNGLYTGISGFTTPSGRIRVLDPGRQLQFSLGHKKRFYRFSDFTWSK